ncbi:MAG: heat shock protein HspQ, partial [Planctomycetota bacterium]|nr:heat shock protein HspQ [Planctomycetota bacterium]
MTDDHRFDIGELVEHKRYGYRGVVAGFDLRCRAGDDWYHGNLTQPSRDQPWYHVLVHGAEHTTYVAEDNLEPDAGGEQVVHPLARLLFQ